MSLRVAEHAGAGVFVCDECRDAKLFMEIQLGAGASLRETMNRVEAAVIRRALREHGGRRTETARSLQITREGLYRKMKRYGIDVRAEIAEWARKLVIEGFAKHGA